jgi:predicted TPR repeat methyltransferase
MVWKDPEAGRRLAAAIQLHRAGRLAEAELTYRDMLAVEPRNPDALHFLGVLCHQRGQSTEAIEFIRGAIAIAPDYADAHHNLGNVLQEVGRIDEAVAAYRRALQLRPRHGPTHTNLGIALRSLGRLDEAVAQHRRAVEVAPDLADGFFSLGTALRERGDLDGAIGAFTKAIELEPKHIGAYQSLGRALYRAGRVADAAAAFEDWLKQQPGHPVASHMRAACTGDDVPARASDGYVQHVFDALASGYDEHLRQLDYRAPQLVIDALAADIGAPCQQLDILDAGCGTGLCGPLLRPYARRLVGVDLSSGMLTRARGRGTYDELVAAELTAYVAGQRQAFDLILSADTLVYFGNLGPVFAASAAALRAGGCLLFTVESADLDEDAPRAGYRINAHGRYSHSETYLRRQLTVSGFAVAGMSAATLRQESGRPVAGYVVTARKRGVEEDR